MNDMFEHVGAVATKAVDRWAWYLAALKNPAEIGKSLKASESDPHQGYYRARFKGGQWQAVAIFYPEGSDQLVGYRDNREARDVNELWVQCLRYPISYEAYQKAISGGGFDDEPPAPIGDNSGNADPLEALRIEYIGEKEQLEEALKKGVKTQADADRVSIWKDRILKIKSRASAMFTAEKAPVLKLARDIDQKYRYLAHDKESDTAAMIERARLGLEAFLKKKRDEENARQQAALAEAARIRREAEEAAEAARKAQEAAEAREDEVGEYGPSADDLRKSAEEAAKRLFDAEREAQARSVSVGRTGAKTSLRTEKVGVVTDYAKAAAALVLMKNTDLFAEIDRIARAYGKLKQTFDGMEIRELDKVR